MMPEPGGDWERASAGGGLGVEPKVVERLRLARKDLVRREVAVKDTDVTRWGKFSRVLGVDYESGAVLFPETDPSPSRRFVDKPCLLRDAIRATMRMQMTDEEGVLSHGTVFAVSPHYALSCIQLGKGRFRAMAGGLVHEHAFNIASRARCHLQMVERVSSHVALLKVSRLPEHGFVRPLEPKLVSKLKTFLLPRLPPCDRCAIVSFPGVTPYLLAAHEQLVEGIICGGDMWEMYRPCMEEELESFRFKNSTLPESSIETLGRRLLYRKLLETFSSLSSGCMAVSIGQLQQQKQETGMLTTTCSAVYGSSGAPVCCGNSSNYFSAVHCGAAEDRLGNRALGCREESFASMYLRHVLGDLPPPEDASWAGLDLDPFLDWLSHHEGLARSLDLGEAENRWLLRIGIGVPARRSKTKFV